MQAFQVAVVGKNPSATARDLGDVGSIPEQGRFPGEGHATHPVFLPGEPHEQGRLAGYSQQCHKESDKTEDTFSLQSSDHASTGHGKKHETQERAQGKLKKNKLKLAIRSLLVMFETDSITEVEGNFY